MRLTIKTDCTYWHKGYERRDYVAGQAVETDDEEFAAVAKAQGWAGTADGEKAEAAAPENKDAAPKRNKKA